MKKIIPEAVFTAEQLNKISALAEKSGLCERTVEILYGRGIDTADKISAFIHPGKDRFLTPFLMSGMKEAVALITRARDEDWSVVIYGDYDADGVCASTVLYRALIDFGICAAVYVPERSDGYGLNVNSIDKIFEDCFPQLFITVDCGISNAKEVEYIKEQGAEVIVTDHHELPEILPDCICINPKICDEYPYDNLCGAGVAFKLGCALNGNSAYKYLDFAAIATVADSVPLTGENRDIVAEGLRQINLSPRKNYEYFFKRDEKITAQTLAFSVAPKINAAGRMGDAHSALVLFLSDDEQVIYDYSVKLSAYNTERQKRCDELYFSVKSMIKEKGANGRVIVLGCENWNAGFVGIVAARLAEEYCRPALLFVKNGENYKGSARSIDGVNIYEALKACAHLIEEFGGHSQAAGVNVTGENLSALEDALNSFLHENYSAEAFTPSHYVNGEITAPVSPQFLRELNLLEPFGVGNHRPQFVLEGNSCRVRALKEGTNHLSVKCAGFDLVYFSGAKQSRLLVSDIPKKLIVDFGVSSYKGREQYQAYMRDVTYEGEGYKYAGDEGKLNAVELALCKSADCKINQITKAEAQSEILNAEEYGTVFICFDPATVGKYNLNGLEVNVFTLSAGNLKSTVLVSPSPDCNLADYEKAVFLDCPPCITLQSFAGKTVSVCSEISGSAALSELNTDRETMLGIFKRLSANGYPVAGDSLAVISRENDFGAPPAQQLFTLKVFEELGLIEFDGSYLTVVRGVKTQLTNSRLYNFVDNLK